jgi:AcrR family transcriptional regulator
MKMEIASNPPRTYRQTARAAAAEATGTRIVEAFLKHLREQWFEEITLDAVARDAGVTVQTIMRRFGSKTGLLEAGRIQIEKEVMVRRSIRLGEVDHTVDVVTDDYEAVGDLIFRLLAQEERHPTLKPLTDYGRRSHREWLASVFVKELGRLSPARRTALLDALVVATDLYVWKLVRREMQRPVSAYKAIAKSLVHAALREAGVPTDHTSTKTKR